MANLERAYELEQRRFSLLRMRLNRERVQEAKQIVADLGGQGLAADREVSKRIAQLRFDKFEQLLCGRIAIRRELALLFPELASSSEIQKLLKSIEKLISYYVAGESQERSVGPSGWLVAQRARYNARCFMDQARLELETLSVEVQLRGPSPGYRPRRRPPRRNPSYETIDRVLRDIAAAGPKSQLDVFRELDGRAPIPNAQPFRRQVGGWRVLNKTDLQRVCGYLERGHGWVYLRFEWAPKE